MAKNEGYFRHFTSTGKEAPQVLQDRRQHFSATFVVCPLFGVRRFSAAFVFVLVLKLQRIASRRREWRIPGGAAENKNKAAEKRRTPNDGQKTKAAEKRRTPNEGSPAKAANDGSRLLCGLR
jgi:hypothetical protein